MARKLALFYNRAKSYVAAVYFVIKDQFPQLLRLANGDTPSAANVFSPDVKRLYFDRYSGYFVQMPIVAHLPTAIFFCFQCTIQLIAFTV